MHIFTNTRNAFPLLTLLSTLPVSVLGGSILSTSGFSSCLSNGTVKVTALDVSYNRDTRVVTFNVAGESTVAQNVTAILTVTAYGQQVYQNSFSPCDYGMTEICPVPASTFASHGSQTIPQEYADKIPSIVFSIPDLDGLVKLELEGQGGEQIGCIESTVGNGKTLNIPAVSYVAAGIAGAALVLSGAGALAGGHAGASTSSPTFTEVIGWFQGMAMNGMLSVQYPSVYRSFATNFAFSTGLVPWGQLQTTIDNFRKSTGGNLTNDNYQYLRHNATLVYDTNNATSSKLKRALDYVSLLIRDGSDISLNGTTASIGGGAGATATASGDTSKENHFVSGLEAYVEKLSIPKSNTFMTVLLVWCIVVAAIIVLILLLKVILEASALMGKLPKSLESWRKRYWWRMAKAQTNLVLLLYGSWTLYCIYQFTEGDSWAAQVLAGVTLGLFTIVLAGFTWRIFTKARQYKKLEGDASGLYEDKDTWVKYNMFYENYKQGYWWLFVPIIIYMFARGAIIAGGNGHGLVQTAGQLIVEGLLLILLLWTRPYQRRSGQWINIFIQVVRVLSVACILVFVEELGIAQTTKTITGVVLIVVQCTLTALLAILIAINAIRNCIMENPHRRARKDAEKRSRDMDNLTPLDARNSLLMDSMTQKHSSTESTDSLYKTPYVSTTPFGDPKGRYDPVPGRPRSPSLPPPGVNLREDFSRPARFRTDSGASDRHNLMTSAASMGRRDDSVSRSPSRQPQLPALDFDHAR